MRTGLLLAVWLITTTDASAAPQAIGTASIVTGKVTVQHAEKKGDWLPLKPGAQLLLGDFIKTNDGAVKLTMEDGSSISLAAKSQLELNEFVYKASSQRRTSFKLWGGRLKASISRFLADNNSVQISTPTAVAGVRGTDFMVAVNAKDETEVVVFEGKVAVKNVLDTIAGEIFLTQGQGSMVLAKQSPGAAAMLSGEALRGALRSASVEGRGSLRSSVTGGMMQAAAGPLGGLTPRGLGEQTSDTPPIDQQATDAVQPATLSIRVRIPGQ